MSGCVNQFNELDYIRMIDLFQNSDFPLHGLFLHRVSQLVLLIDFQCEAVSSYFVLNQFDHGVGSLTDLATQIVTLKTIIALLRIRTSCHYKTLMRKRRLGGLHILLFC